MKNEKNSSVSRRRAIGLLGLGVIAMQYPMNWYQVKSDRKNLKSKELHYLTIQEIGELIRTKEVSSVELTENMLERINTIDVELHSYITVLKVSALLRAGVLDEELKNGKYRGPLHGVPIAVKDLFYTRDVRTTGGTIVNDFVPDFDATVVSRLKEAGAVILGKLSMSEGAYVSHHPDFKVPKNPWDHRRFTGVSSSGSGVATAAGLCFGSLGTDTGGSIRFPSAANGIVGLKPTYGRVSRYGVMPLALSMDHVGPMTRSVADAATMFQIIAGSDPNDPECLNNPVPNITSKLDGNIKGVRIGFDSKYASENVEKQVKEATQSVLEVLTSLGAEIIEVQMPDVSQLVEAWVKIAGSEAVMIHSETYPSLLAEYGEGFRKVLEASSKLSEIELKNARKIRAEITAGYEQMLSTVDAFVCPTMWCPPGIYAEAEIPGDFRSIDPSPWTNEIFTKPANFSGSPSLTVPCGFTDEGIPLSVQFIGKKLSEEMICRIGYAYEQKTEWHKKHPDV
ncbi:amidase [Christiangramia gaetbulicola]|uniref:Amidase n=1 Tax=Christiangramia gaetbulicola TaxID=703340 RepID=A0A2T6AI37_9FLAO|nr:amidase [Christiangramia gaetbulicola]